MKARLLRATVFGALCLGWAVDRAHAVGPAWSQQEPSPPAAHEATARPGEAREGADHGVVPPQGHEAAAPADTEGGEAHSPAAVLMHHVTDEPLAGALTKHLLFFLFAALAVIVVIQSALRTYTKDGVPSGIGAAVESVVLFIRDEIAEKNIGHGDGARFTPLLCSFFFFILIAALLGLVPFPVYRNGHWQIFSATSTGNIAVTAGLATISFIAQQYGGISKNGLVGHFKGLVPHGLPVWLLPIMIPLEILSMFTKPFALMVRLFANMLAGHMVITALLLLIPLMAAVSVAFGLAMAPVSLALSLFIMVLEVLVAFIQAYIFTLLTSIFIGMYAHPAH